MSTMLVNLRDDYMMYKVQPLNLENAVLKLWLLTTGYSPVNFETINPTQSQAAITPYETASKILPAWGAGLYSQVIYPYFYVKCPPIVFSQVTGEVGFILLTNTVNDNILWVKRFLYNGALLQLNKETFMLSSTASLTEDLVIYYYYRSN